MSPIDYADRIKTLPPYPFAAIDAARDRAKAQGKDIISLGVGDPDLPTPSFIVEALREAVLDPATHRYPDYTGRLDFRTAASEYMRSRFGLSFDPEKEVLALIGSKEGLAHIPLAFVDPGDLVLCPDPGYPVYPLGTAFSGGEVRWMPLLPERGFMPDLSAIPPEEADRAKMMFLNYPNNPTGAVAKKGFLEEVVDFCLRHRILLVYDNAYSELAFGDTHPPSIFETEGARETAIEFHSLSKSFNMTGWRIGFAVGSAHHVGGLGRIKTNVDSGAFDAIQIAAREALKRHNDPEVLENHRIYGSRRKACEDKLAAMGITFHKTPATFYIWFKTPTEETSAAFAARVLEETGVVLTPGTAFGATGEGWMRIALTVDAKRLTVALDRLASVI